MAILGDITVVDSDLVKVFPSINDFKFEGQSDFSETIAISKREIYREIKSLTDKSETEMDNVRDTDQGNIKDKIVFNSLSHIFLYNGNIELAGEYKIKSDAIPLYFHDDFDGDNTLDDGEEYLITTSRIGR